MERSPMHMDSLALSGKSVHLLALKPSSSEFWNILKISSDIQLHGLTTTGFLDLLQILVDSPAPCLRVTLNSAPMYVDGPSSPQDGPSSPQDGWTQQSTGWTQQSTEWMDPAVHRMDGPSSPQDGWTQQSTGWTQQSTGWMDPAVHRMDGPSSPQDGWTQQSTGWTQ
ncbi:hypothetical protein STEG23_004048 [Scotinomys teguina]